MAIPKSELGFLNQPSVKCSAKCRVERPFLSLVGHEGSSAGVLVVSVVACGLRCPPCGKMGMDEEVN